jgi:hypothetical protein
VKKNEIDSFLVDWQNYYIWYPPNMKELTNHNVAPLEIFLQPKIIFCQHSQRLRAYYDTNGTYVTKDVYPIVSLKKDDNRDINGWLLTAYFNSTIFSALYNTIYHGITIGSDYYHYLPTYLNEIKFILPEEETQKKIIYSTKKIQTYFNTVKKPRITEIKNLYDHLDLQISISNGLSKTEHDKMIELFKNQGIIQPWEN